MVNTIENRERLPGLTYFQAPPELRDRIRATLRARRPERASWWRHWSWTALAPLATAAFAVLSSVNVALIAALPSSEERVADEIVASHLRALMTARPIDVASSDQHTVKPWYAGKLDFSPPVKDFAAEGFALVGGRIDYVNGRTVAALVYRRGAHFIDVFEWPASGETGEEPATLARRGYNIVHGSNDGMAHWLASDLETPLLLQLEALLARANRM